MLLVPALTGWLRPSFCNKKAYLFYLLKRNQKLGVVCVREELTLPGFIHDTCSTVHPLAADSPFFQTLPLAEFGLQYLFADIALAHPFDDGEAVPLLSDVFETASCMGADQAAYLKLMKPLLDSWKGIREEVLAPLHIRGDHPLDMAAFGWKALASARQIAKRFQTEKARGFWGGLALHSQIPFESYASSAIGLVLLTAGHKRGWPVVAGGSGSLAHALAHYFERLGGKIELNHAVNSLSELPSARAVLFDITPRQLLKIAGHDLSTFYRFQLNRYRYGMGVFKIDWALAEPIPFKSVVARRALTVHLGGHFDEMAAAEADSWSGRHPEKPPMILVQPTLVDPGRAPGGQHIGWAYCHVPAGSVKDMTGQMEMQVERFAPGFRERILARHTMNTRDMETHNANNISGDISGGANNLSQLFSRPALRFAPYRSSVKGIYLCSSSTPPGGGVHGMCGYHAAQRAIKDIFREIRE